MIWADFSNINNIYLEDSLENPTQIHAVIATLKILIMQSFQTGGGT